ncbi:MAG: class I SAM-dependent methyltransferase [SAR324 cluster bacterium]|nr:class I SAM-dependent methyltransferase [SAR324 cluster bacterium]
MGIYTKHVLPRLINLACSSGPVMRQRQKVVPLAKGRVLEIGIGSGLNLQFYDPAQIELLWGLEPAREMRAMLERKISSVPFKMELIGLPGEEIPLESESVDTVLITYTLCTIADPMRAFEGMRRVLKKGGRLIFCEHGSAPDEKVRRWQDRVNPFWNLIGGGCHLNRPIPLLIKQGGFAIERIETMYLPGWKPASFNYWGTAVPS